MLLWSLKTSLVFECRWKIVAGGFAGLCFGPGYDWGYSSQWYRGEV